MRSPSKRETTHKKRSDSVSKVATHFFNHIENNVQRYDETRVYAFYNSVPPDHCFIQNLIKKVVA